MRWRTAPLAPTASLKAVSSRPLSFSEHFSSTSKSFDQLLKLAQDQGVAHSLCRFNEHRLWALTARLLQRYGGLFTFLLLEVLPGRNLHPLLFFVGNCRSLLRRCPAWTSLSAVEGFGYPLPQLPCFKMVLPPSSSVPSNLSAGTRRNRGNRWYPLCHTVAPLAPWAPPAFTLHL